MQEMFAKLKNKFANNNVAKICCKKSLQKIMLQKQFAKNNVAKTCCKKMAQKRLQKMLKINQ